MDKCGKKFNGSDDQRVVFGIWMMEKMYSVVYMDACMRWDHNKIVYNTR